MALSLAANLSGRLDGGALLLCFIGAVAMRGAGCTFNDIVDARIDAQVTRTSGRPIPSGQVSRRKALIFLIGQSLVGLIVLIQFNTASVALGAASLVLVAIYPFMKRITWWPQLFLGLAFSWGALMGFSITEGRIGLPALLLYAGAILWTIGYDTIYALQDREDDALIGVKSTARLFGNHVRTIVGLFYAGTTLLWALAILATGGGPISFIGLLVAAGHLGWQVQTLAPDESANALARFKSNHVVGLVLSLGFALDALIA
jgi:4-hydroxybenzoate polyprenyltransferase